MTPGFFAAAGAGVVFLAAVGVGLVPSGLVAFTGVFLTGVALAVDEVEVLLVVGVAFVADVVALAAGVEEVAAETGFLVAVTGVFFTAVVLDVGLDDSAGTTFFVAVVVFAGVAFAGAVPALAEAAGFVAFSFRGAFRTGVAAEVAFVVAAGVDFFTGVVAFDVAEDVVFLAVAGAFFVVCWAPSATFEILSTLAAP
jgi:hypothetical protein